MRHLVLSLALLCACTGAPESPRADWPRATERAAPARPSPAPRTAPSAGPAAARDRDAAPSGDAPRGPAHGRFFASVDGARVDVTATMQRIASGGRNEHRNDGTPFQNRERRLPLGRGYTEYVVPTPGGHGPGPQRIVIDDGGKAYYTPDHYGHFYPVSRE